MANIIFIFVDGLGIAPASDANPLAQASMPTLRGLLGDAFVTGPTIRDDAAMMPIDATLGVAGLPQSGTGQATLMTGENCPRIHGSHFGPYPPSAVRPVVNQRNLFSRCAALDLPFEFANAYPQKYFDYLAKHPVMKATIASSFEAAGGALHTADDLIAQRAVSGDILGERWRELGHDGISPLTAAHAGERLARLAEERAFTMFEFWLTDKAGHSQNMEAACAALERIDGLIGGAIAAMGPDTLLVLSSDHGNVEDLTVGTHTFNPVPLLAIGRGAAAFVDGAQSLMDIAPRVISALIA